MAAEETIASLRGVLGDSVDHQEAARLLQDAGGSVEAAVATYFAEAETDGDVAAAAADPVLALRAVIGNDNTDEQLRALLESAGASVDAAADKFFTLGLPAVGPSGRRSAQDGARQARRQPRQAAVQARSAIAEELQQEARLIAAVAAAGTGSRGRARDQPASAVARGSVAAVPTRPRSNGRRRRRSSDAMPEPQRRADNEASESSTDGSSTGSEAVTDEGSGEAPDSGSEDTSGGEDADAPGEVAFPALPAGPSRDEEVWEPTEDMLAEYEAAQTGEAPRRRRRTHRRSAQAAQHYFQAVARMANMVALPSSDDEAPGDAARRPKPGGSAKRGKGKSGAESSKAVWNASTGSLNEDSILEDSLPPIAAPIDDDELLSIEMLTQIQATSVRMRQKLPFEGLRRADGRLFARGPEHAIPASHLVPLESLKWPMHLGTFHFDIGTVKAEHSDGLRQTHATKLHFRALSVTVKDGKGRHVREVKLGGKKSYNVGEICRSAVMDVTHQATPKAPWVKLCSLGGPGHPLTALFGALGHLRGQELLALKASLEPPKAGEERFRLALCVMLKKGLPTFDGPSEDASKLYQAPRALYGQPGEAAVPPIHVKERGEMFRIIAHHLLAHGSGLALGPDCDGVLNHMDGLTPDTLPQEERASSPDGRSDERAALAAAGEGEAPLAQLDALSALPEEPAQHALPEHVGDVSEQAPEAGQQGRQLRKRLRRDDFGGTASDAGAPSANPAAERPKKRTRQDWAAAQPAEPPSVIPDIEASASLDAEGLGAPAEAADPDSDLSRIMMAGALAPDFPAADQPDELTSQARGWQLKGLKWMLEREQTGDPLRCGNLRLHPCWLQLRSQDGQLLYFHRMAPLYISTNFYSAPAGGTCGGFLADVMGLGKTLQIIMLILKNPAPPDWPIQDLDAAKGVNWSYGQKPQLSLKTTLVVVPNNLRLQWLSELRKHLKPGALTWCTYSTALTIAKEDGPRPFLERNALTALWGHRDGGEEVPVHTCDVAVVTYQDLMLELRREKRPPLLQWGYWRLCLDEAQLVSRTNTQAANAVSDIYRRHAWTVTGTPITSKLEEIQGLLAFLDLEPYYHQRPWNLLLDREGNGGGPCALLPLCTLLRSVMLRRRKEDIGPDLELPPCRSEDRWLDLTKVERAVYDAKRDEMQAAVNLYVRSRASAEANVRRHVNRCKALLTDLRQACCDPQMVRRKDEESTSQRRSMTTIMADLVAKAFQAYDGALRGFLQQKLLLASVKLAAEREAAKVIEETRQALVRCFDTDIAALMAGRSEDGATPAGRAGGGGPDDATVEAATQQLRPEVDALGGRVPWHVTWRREKRRAAEAAGTLAPIVEDPDPRLAWDQAEEGQVATSDAATSGAPVDGSAATGQAAAEGSRGSARQRSGQREPVDKAAKQAAARERQARREAIKKRNAARQAEYETWLDKQAPPPANEADELEEQLARMAHQRLRAWARALLDAYELHADLLRVAWDAPPEPLPALLEEDEDEPSSSVAAPQPDYAVQLSQVSEQVNALNDLLGEDPATVAAAAVGEEPRFSRRKRALEPDQALASKQYEQLLQSHAAKERAANVLIADMDKLKSRKHPERIARGNVSVAARTLTEQWSNLRRQAALQEEVLAKEKGKSIAAPGAKSAAGVSEVEQEDIYTCPICTDLAEKRTVTTCGHFFCSDCLGRALAIKGICPLCRRRLTAADLFDAYTPEEAADAAQRAPQASGKFSSKVNAVVTEVSRMCAQRKGAKAVVFSTWSRLLKVLATALRAHKIGYASLATAQDQRSSSLDTFMSDPDCAVLLVVLSTLGGAAGLTLTVADTVILMEPSLLPGLEAQAAGRIHRLGQTRETRVIRLLARGTVEEGVLAEQRRRLSRRTGGGEATMVDVDPGTLLAVVRGHVTIPELSPDRDAPEPAEVTDAALPVSQ